MFSTAKKRNYRLGYERLVSENVLSQGNCHADKPSWKALVCRKPPKHLTAIYFRPPVGKMFGDVPVFQRANRFVSSSIPLAERCGRAQTLHVL